MVPVADRRFFMGLVGSMYDVPKAEREVSFSASRKLSIAKVCCDVNIDHRIHLNSGCNIKSTAINHTCLRAYAT